LRHEDDSAFLRLPAIPIIMADKTNTDPQRMEIIC
jgi:hypothetical protein